jgi:glycosyltransferase involved in cell wall biosynthesis
MRTRRSDPSEVKSRLRESRAMVFFPHEEQGSDQMDQGRGPGVALVYDDDAYEEGYSILDRPAESVPGGLMGRRVAGRSFLEAYLRTGMWSGLSALVRDRASAGSLVRLWREHPATRDGSRTLRIIERASFDGTFFNMPPATILHAPQPPAPEFAWARQTRGPHAFALSGVTHTLCSPQAVELLQSLVTAPFESYDALICTSRAVASMVLEITGTYADHLRGRLGAVGVNRPARAFPSRLETIPLGVDVDRFRPAGLEERNAARRSIGVADDEVAALYVGRLSHHAKAHPFPMFRGASEAARATGQKVHLILAGWSAHPAVHAAYISGAREFAPGVRTTLLDGRDPSTRRSVWHAADLFVSPSDSIQETFGLAVLEAMASGLPVVASDWDGYRDLVRDGETGFLVPTLMVDGATVGATARLLVGELTYDRFLAECSQATAVDVPAMAGALARLVGDAALRRRLGEAGRRRAAEHFAWPRIVRAYEQLWGEQESERSARGRLGADDGGGPARWRGADGPAVYPSPERTFAGYPTVVLDARDRVVPTRLAGDAIADLLAQPLAHHVPGGRVRDPQLLSAALARTPCSVEDLDAFWSEAGVEHGVGRASLAWMLKYDLLRAVRDDRTDGGIPR